MDIGEYIKQRRNALKLSLADLARRLTDNGYAVERQTISHWENARNKPPIDSYSFRFALARSLEVSTNDIAMEIGLFSSDDDHTPEARRVAMLVDAMSADMRTKAVKIIESLAD